MKFNYSARKILAGILVSYFLVFFFSYFYFMTIGSVATGAAIYSDFDQSVIENERPIIIKTITTLSIILLIFIAVYVVPKIIFKKYLKNKKMEIPRYKPFKNL